ncbi:MAG: AMP-binding protein [Gemmatimonadota bacterium]
MSAYTAHVDTFARENLPPLDQWPELLFELPELRYPARVNCASVLLDEAVAEGHGERTALLSRAGSWSYGLLLERANRIARVLTEDMGLVPGNRVLLRAPNSPLLVACWLAVVKAGGIAVTTMPLLRARELRGIAEKARIRHALCDARLVEELEQAGAGTGWLGERMTFGGGELEEAIEGKAPAFENVVTAADDVCLLAFTSGTTGRPKATMHFHRDVLAMTDTVARHLLATGPTDVYLGSPPIGFTYGLGGLLAFPLRFRGAVALVERPTPEALATAAREFGATCLFTAPTLYRTLLRELDPRDLRSIRRYVSAGEPLPRSTSDAWYEATGRRIIDGIGTTEMLHIFIAAAASEIRPGATGKPVPGYRACVLGEEDAPLPQGSTGRLAVKGPTGCRYLADERQREYVVNGWNVTGDRYRVDEDGYYWFEARADDMILSAGYNIAGPEVEETLLEHDAVGECAVVGAPDPARGCIVKAFVVLNPGFDEGDGLVANLQDHVKRSIAPYKYPRAIEFVASLPRTETGKLQRFKLRERA